MFKLENGQPLCINRVCYSGYLDQSEFAQRYLFIKNRVNNSLTREELAFLLGRSPYFITDFEELLASAKLDLVDIDLLPQFLTRNKYETLIFDKKDGQFDISSEKRMVRVTRFEYLDNIQYDFKHKWYVNGENEVLKIKEPKFQTYALEDESKKLIRAELAKLIASGYFNIKRSPIEIREQIWQSYKHRSNAWCVSILKNIIYDLIRDERLRLIHFKGHYNYQLLQRK